MELQMMSYINLIWHMQPLLMSRITSVDKFGRKNFQTSVSSCFHKLCKSIIKIFGLNICLFSKKKHVTTSKTKHIYTIPGQA